MSGPLRINLQDKIVFFESILIPAFDKYRKLDTPEKRIEWMRQEATNTNWDERISAELIKRFGAVETREEAKLEKSEAERKLEKEEE